MEEWIATAKDLKMKVYIHTDKMDLTLELTNSIYF
jgi:hypothetical protein